jgi:hypothetical protein
MLIKTGETHQAQRELQAILDTPTDPAWSFEAARDKRQAVEMLKESVKEKR